MNKQSDEMKEMEQTNVICIYDESDIARCPACAEELKLSSGRKRICINCGFVVACCN